jgi:four helix bundle protein
MAENLLLEIEGALATLTVNRPQMRNALNDATIEEIHEAIKEFPTPDFSGLRYQLAKAANSVAANIAEGYGRDTDNERRNRLRTSRGELEETQSHLKVAGRLRYMQEKRFYRIWKLTVVLLRMLVQLMRKC